MNKYNIITADPPKSLTAIIKSLDVGQAIEGVENKPETIRSLARNVGVATGRKFSTRIINGKVNIYRTA